MGEVDRRSLHLRRSHERHGATGSLVSNPELVRVVPLLGSRTMGLRKANSQLTASNPKSKLSQHEFFWASSAAFLSRRRQVPIGDKIRTTGVRSWTSLRRLLFAVVSCGRLLLHQGRFFEAQ